MGASLLLVGCGKMGGALLSGWLDQGIAPADIAVIEPDPAGAGIARQAGLRVHADLAALPAGDRPATVVFAVKPQILDAVAPAFRRFAAADTLFLSIAAGKPIGFFEGALSAEAAIVRAMPNTPAAVGRGITVACANAAAGAAHRDRAGALLEAVGEVAWIEDEGLMDAVTALSGSGPAYVFLLIECLAQAGVAAGLPAGLADRLALATVAGSGELARRAAEPPARLRENVTSPGGTTAAALEVLMAPDGLRPLLDRAVAAAAARSRELAG